MLDHIQLKDKRISFIVFIRQFKKNVRKKANRLLMKYQAAKDEYKCVEKVLHELASCKSRLMGMCWESLYKLYTLL